MVTTLEESDREELILARVEGRKVAPDVAQRIRQRADQMRQEILRKHGVQNIGVDIIRQIRDAG